MQNDSLKAIHDEDLLEWLDSIGYKDKIESKKVLCFCCSKHITFKNLLAIKYFENQYRFSCDAPFCYNSFVSGNIESRAK